jgi:aspartate/methionine/tyrosine aminotransferase
LATKDSSSSTRPITLAARSQPFQESVIREMTRLGDETGSVNLSQGLPDFEPPASVLAAAISAIQSGENQYTFPFGSNTFRKAISNKTSRYNHILADPETEITVTCGVSEAIMAVILALTDPGDEVIILEPWYENYLPDCYMAGCQTAFCITPRTRLHI